MTGKHAYLIIAHDRLDQLRILIQCLDDIRNDIYIHVDLKTNQFRQEDFDGAAEFSRLVFVERMDVTWGGYSLIACEMRLLKAAVQEGYDYYHLLSGVCLPVKTQDEIHQFVRNNQGKEFIGFSERKAIPADMRERYCVYHFFQDKVGRTKSFMYYMEKLLVRLQKLVRVDRTRAHRIVYQGGHQWWSISHELAVYLCGQEALIKDLFSYTICCDEFFVQTLVFNSRFYQKVYRTASHNGESSSMRLIDWERGNPYTYTIEDYEILLQSEELFARKFSMNTNETKSLVMKIAEYISGKRK